MARWSEAQAVPHVRTGRAMVDKAQVHDSLERWEKTDGPVVYPSQTRPERWGAKLPRNEPDWTLRLSGGAAVPYI